jgi:hypothetical protein
LNHLSVGSDKPLATSLIVHYLFRVTQGMKAPKPNSHSEDHLETERIGDEGRFTRIVASSPQGWQPVALPDFAIQSAGSAEHSAAQREILGLCHVVDA